jgi:ABC-2 type transport system permease protein
MNAALWKKAIGEAKWLLVGCTLLMFGFHWVFVWLSNMIELGPLTAFVRSLPRKWVEIYGVPVAEMLTPAGRIVMAYADAVVLIATGVWAIARGSDAVSGQLDRGTMEMVLAQPVRRGTILAIQAVVTLSGAAVLAVAGWVGTWVGVTTVALKEPVTAATFIPAAWNVFALTVFLAGITTAASACDRYRWRTVGLVGSFYMVEMVIVVIGRMATEWKWVSYFSFLTAFMPQALISGTAEAWSLSLRYNGVLLGLGLAGYVFAAVVFCRRDLPAPL